MTSLDDHLLEEDMVLSRKWHTWKVEFYKTPGRTLKEAQDNLSEAWKSDRVSLSISAALLMTVATSNIMTGRDSFDKDYASDLAITLSVTFYMLSAVFCFSAVWIGTAQYLVVAKLPPCHVEETIARIHDHSACCCNGLWGSPLTLLVTGSVSLVLGLLSSVYLLYGFRICWIAMIPTIGVFVMALVTWNRIFVLSEPDARDWCRRCQHNNPT